MELKGAAKTLIELQAYIDCRVQRSILRRTRWKWLLASEFLTQLNRELAAESAERAELLYRAALALSKRG